MIILDFRNEIKILYGSHRIFSLLNKTLVPKTSELSCSGIPRRGLLLQDRCLTILCIGFMCEL